MSKKEVKGKLKQVSFYLTEEEKAFLDKLADTKGSKSGIWIKIKVREILSLEDIEGVENPFKKKD